MTAPSQSRHVSVTRPPTQAPRWPRPAALDETLVTRLFPNTNPIGKHVAFEFMGRTRQETRPIRREIVGVVRYVRHYGLASGPSFVQVYTPFVQLPLWFERRRPSMARFARTALDPELLAGSIRHEVTSIDPDIVGIYGVVSHLVGQRTREIGVRIALGASRADVLRLIVGEGMVPIGIGILLGVGTSWALTRLISDQLYTVSPHDPVTFAGLAALLALVGLAAHYIPARSATRVDPLVALRAE